MTDRVRVLEIFVVLSALGAFAYVIARDARAKASVVLDPTVAGVATTPSAASETQAEGTFSDWASAVGLDNSSVLSDVVADTLTMPSGVSLFYGRENASDSGATSSLV